MMAQITILIPFLNESANIPFLVQSLNEFCRLRDWLSFEVIFIDDGSTDNSVELLQKQKHEFYSYKIIKLSKNFGSHAALRAGILHAKGEFITFMYADLQDPLELVVKLYQEIQEKKVEIAWACRNEKQGWFSGFYAKLMQKFAVKNFPETGFDIVMFSRKVQKLLNENIEANSSIFLQILTLGFSQSSISYQKQPRKAGKSKWTLSKKV
ncbi:MAG: glycosyltransferase family 2 protein, partial [Microscillaceae bacterium]|nr:glycosyltransferase family 2 protein [Microscillaceae bacterium]MDW8460623.1 glycosyltransferase family 2 protein [Cytophagales bacterium]